MTLAPRIQAASGWVATLVLAGALTPSSSATQAPGTISQGALEAIARLECRFAVRVSVSWLNNQPTVTVRERAGQLALDISEINTLDGTATATDGPRPMALSARSDRSNLYFMEVRRDEVVVSTTVFSQETEPGRLKAVHTRSGPNPEQFYGECRVVR